MRQKEHYRKRHREGEMSPVMDESLRRCRDIVRAAVGAGGSPRIVEGHERQAEEVRPCSTLSGKPLKTSEEERDPI